MTDITELAQSLKAAAVRAKTATEDYVAGRMSMSVCLSECAEFNDLSDGPDNILALVEALEKAQQHIARQEQIILNQDEALSIRRGELEKAQAQSSKWLEAYHKAVSIGARYEERIAELESRTVTVKLPELCVGVVQSGHAVMVPYAGGHWFNKTAILEMLTAAGIKWEAE